MIYLITGVPGSGKTLYAVSTLIQKLAAEKIKGDDGQEIERRVVIDGIPDLVIPHEMMAPPLKSHEGKTDRGDGDGLWNWHKWCKPGDVLVVDEVQRHWRPRGMSTKPPEEITMLETHRHLGVDFIIITQNPMLIDQNVRRLVGRHQHVRRLFGGARAAIYDWDGCSVDVHRTGTATTTYWGYPKDAYKLYKSSELHTKQKQKIPIWLVVPVLGIIGGIFLAPQAMAVMTGAATGKGISSKKVEVPPPVLPAPVSLPPAPATPGQQTTPPVAGTLPPAPLPGTASDKPVIAGCIRTATRCGCVDEKGVAVDVEEKICHSLAPSGTKVVDLGPDTPISPESRFAFEMGQMARTAGPSAPPATEKPRGPARSD